MEKQTAVEWLCSQIYTIQVELKAGNQSLKDKIDKALKMEKQQIIDASEEGNDWDNAVIIDGEDYYKKTFKSE
jgi:hypothetical protein